MTLQKRILDVVLALVLIVPAMPVLLILLLILMLTQGRPFFYVSERM